MISEKQTNVHIMKSNFGTKIQFDQMSADSSAPTDFSIMKTDFHKKIRNKQLDKIKAEKRRAHQVHIAIESILQSDFPKESSQVKTWTDQLTELYKKTKTYETDPHKLRQIFYFALRFPSLGTLRLFYFAVLTTDAKNIRTLVDVDVWRFLHNILKDATKQPITSRNLFQNSQSQSFSPPSLVPVIDTTDLKMTKLVIETFIVMFDKDIAIRDYSIGVHLTYSGYLAHAYNKFNDHIRSQMIYFLMAVLRQPPKQYKKDYLHVMKLAIGMIKTYNQKIRLFMDTKQWQISEIKETIEQAISRIRNLFGLLCKAFTHASTKWLNEFLNNKNSTFVFNYYQNTFEFLTFGMWVLEELIVSKDYNKQFYQTFGKTIEMVHNLFVFFMVMSEKTFETEPESAQFIKGIMGKVTLMLNFIKNCQQSKVFIHAEKDLLQQVEKTKHICLFSIQNGLKSQFDTYHNFIKPFIFYSDKESNRINLLELLAYLLRTTHYELVMTELIQVIHTLLSIEVPEQQIERYKPLSYIFEQVMEMMEDKVVIGNTKASIVTCSLQYFVGKENKNSIGFVLGVDSILVRSINKFHDFMYSNSCTEEVFAMLEELIQFAQHLKRA